MTNEHTNTMNNGSPSTGAVDINSTASLCSIFLISVIGVAVFIVQPGFIQGLVEYYGFTEQQAGYIASIEMWGIALATLFMHFLLSRFNWRKLLLCFAALIVAGNLGSMLTDVHATFALLRFLTGLGSGGMIAMGFALVGLTRHPDRNFGIVIICVISYGALGMWLMPTAFHTIGMKGLLVFFALFGVSAIPFFRFLPSSGEEHVEVADDAVDLPAPHKIMAIGTMFFYFIAQGVVWAFLFLIGLDAGANERSVANYIALSQVAGVAGALIPVLVGARFGRIIPISLGIALSCVSLAILLGDVTVLTFALVVCLYNFAWNATHPFLLAAMASFDRKGKVLVNAVAGQMLGLAIGPALGAVVLGQEGYDNIVFAGLVTFVIAYVLVLPPILKHLRQLKTA